MRLPQNNYLSRDDESSAEQALVSPELNAYIEHYFGHSLDELMAPIGESQVGESVRHNGVYFQIKEARRADDQTLPQGVWTHEMKTADWGVVEKTALNALCSKSKDLQLGVWLMESSINRYGFNGVAPAAVLIHALCQSYWDSMHPQMQDGDIEFRTNPINWINEKVALQLRLVPITHSALDGAEMSWNDWESAQRYEQLKLSQKNDVEWEGATSEAFKQRLAATSKTFLISQCKQLEDGCRAIDELVNWLNQQCGEDSPSLGEVTSLMKSVLSLSQDELRRRGVRFTTANEDNEESDTSAANGNNDGHGSGAGSGNGGSDNGDFDLGPIKNRADAYAKLREAAAFLMNDDPHSPAPYLINTACDWGTYSAPDLYRYLFLEKGGQLSVFEIMGLDVGKTE